MDLDVTLIRHAEAAWDDGSDPPLTARGSRQAACLAERAARWKKPTHVLVSPSLRARQTADPLCAALGVTADVVPWLQEIHIAGGTSLGAARAADAVDERAWAEFRARTTGGLAAVLSAAGALPSASMNGLPQTWTLRGADARFLLIGHGMANAVLLEYLLGVEGVPWAGHRLQFGHAAFAGVRAFALARGAVLGLIRYNETGHLPREIRTM
jgi:broad specificity phosphatase PhoE